MCIKYNISMINNEIKKKITYIIIPIIIGSLIGILTRSHVFYIKASVMPPDIVFPIVWTILYGILGYTYYLLNNEYSTSTVIKKIFILQLLINYIWPIIFFKFGLFFVSFLWIILLDIVVLIMLLNFYKINLKIFYLNLTYIIWLLFATVLNYMTYMIN